MDVTDEPEKIFEWVGPPGRKRMKSVDPKYNFLNPIFNKFYDEMIADITNTTNNNTDDDDKATKGLNEGRTVAKAAVKKLNKRASRKMNKRFTKEENAKFRDMVNSDMDYDQIAKVFNISVSSVKKKILDAKGDVKSNKKWREEKAKLSHEILVKLPNQEKFPGTIEELNSAIAFMVLSSDEPFFLALRIFLQTKKPDIIKKLGLASIDESVIDEFKRKHNELTRVTLNIGYTNHWLRWDGLRLLRGRNALLQSNLKHTHHCLMVHGGLRRYRCGRDRRRMCCSRRMWHPTPLA